MSANLSVVDPGQGGLKLDRNRTGWADAAIEKTPRANTVAVKRSFFIFLSNITDATGGSAQ
jgi:hypothetical protein